MEECIYIPRPHTHLIESTSKYLGANGFDDKKIIDDSLIYANFSSGIYTDFNNYGLGLTAIWSKCGYFTKMSLCNTIIELTKNTFKQNGYESKDPIFIERIEYYKTAKLCNIIFRNFNICSINHNSP